MILIQIGLILICNSLLIGLTLYYACFLMLSRFTFSQVQNPVQFVFKLFLSALAINYSLFIVEQFVTLFSNISLSIREISVFLLLLKNLIQLFTLKIQNLIFFL